MRKLLSSSRTLGAAAAGILVGSASVAAAAVDPLTTITTASTAFDTVAVLAVSILVFAVVTRLIKKFAK